MHLKAFLSLVTILLLSVLLSGCDLEIFGWKFDTVVAPPAQTVAAQGGRIAQTQAAKLLQTAQGKIATESADLKETAKVQAATIAAGLIDTAQARLVTESAGKVTAAPTQLSETIGTVEAGVQTQAAARFPALQTESAALLATSEARLATAAVQDFPLSMTQAAAFYQTAQARLALVPSLPPLLDEQPADLAATAANAAAILASQAAPLLATPLPVPSQMESELIVYLTREGDALPQIASQFSIPLEDIFQLNQLRYPGLSGAVDQLPAGLTLILARRPNDGSPVQPANQAPWSNTPGCNVSQVDWLAAPLNCLPAEIDLVTKVEMTAACISFSNPLGYTQTHEILRGWMLKDANNARSYAWFIDQARRAVIAGPAVVSEKTIYTECKAPER